MWLIKRPAVAVGLSISVWMFILLIYARAMLAAPVFIHDSSPPDGLPKRSSSAIAITADGGTLLVVNPDSNSLTLADTSTRLPLVELPVGTDPRTVSVDDLGRRAYVANRGSSSISVVDIVARTVITEVAVGNLPYGVLVMSDIGRLFVAEQGMDQVRIMDPNTLATLAVLPTEDRPNGLAISNNGRTLYVSHLLTNTISVLTVYPYEIYLPLVTIGGAAHGPSYTPQAGLKAYRLRAFQSAAILLWPDSNLVQSIVLSPDSRTAYIPHTRSNSHNPALTFDTTVFPLVSLVDLQTLQHLVDQQIDLGTVDPPGVGLPIDAAITADGQELWVLNAASNDVSVVDLLNRRLVAHIEVGDNPRGIVLSPDGAAAYVNNTLAGTVSILDTASYSVVANIAVTDIPLPPLLLNGKRLFHSSDDPRMARAQWISCNTCHFEGEQDGRTWRFGFAGPRNTTSLLGMIETYPLRWSGEWNESADSLFANRKENFGSGLVDGEMNCAPFPPDCVHYPPNQGRSYDLDSLAAFLDSLHTPLSPTHARGEPLSPAEQRGQALFNDYTLGCIVCHPPPLYTDLQSHDVGTATPDERIGPAYDTPTLRGLYNSAPYLHDGSAATLYTALTRSSPGREHDLSSVLTEEEIQDLATFLLALPFER